MSRRDEVHPVVPAGPPPAPELPPEHRRRWLVRTVVAVGVVLALLAGSPWIYATFLAPDADEPLALATPAPQSSEPEVPATVPVAELDGAWAVVEGSEAGYRLEEVLSGQPVTVVGRTDQVTGAFTVAEGVITSGEVVVDVASVETDETARDAYFRRAMDTTTFPDAVFTLDQPVDVTAVAGTTDPVAVAASGQLTMHGVAQPVVAELQVLRTVSGVEVVGTVPVTLGDFGLTAPDLGFVTVQPTGVVEMRLLLAH